MVDIEWHKGRPPFPGWWRMRERRKPNGSSAWLELWHWYDGRATSMGAYEYHGPEEAAYRATLKGVSISEMEWCWDWPKGAKVMRKAPHT